MKLASILKFTHGKSSTKMIKEENQEGLETNIKTRKWKIKKKEVEKYVGP